jgi:hypothetical protein
MVRATWFPGFSIAIVGRGVRLGICWSGVALSQPGCEGDWKPLPGSSNREFSPRKTAHLELSVCDPKAVNAVSLTARIRHSPPSSRNLGGCFPTRCKSLRSLYPGFACPRTEFTIVFLPPRTLDPLARIRTLRLSPVRRKTEVVRWTNKIEVELCMMV